MNTVGKTFVIVNPIFRVMLEKNLSERGFSKKEQIKREEEAICHVHETGTIQDLDLAHRRNSGPFSSLHLISTGRITS